MLTVTPMVGLHPHQSNLFRCLKAPRQLQHAPGSVCIERAALVHMEKIAVRAGRCARVR